MRLLCTPRAFVAVATLAVSLVVASVRCDRQAPSAPRFRNRADLHDRLYGKTCAEVEALLGTAEVRMRNQPHGGETWGYYRIYDLNRKPWPPMVRIEFDACGAAQHIYVSTDYDDVSDDEAPRLRPPSAETTPGDNADSRQSGVGATAGGGTPTLIPAAGASLPHALPFRRPVKPSRRQQPANERINDDSQGNALAVAVVCVSLNTQQRVTYAAHACGSAAGLR